MSKKNRERRAKNREVGDSRSLMEGCTVTRMVPLDVAGLLARLEAKAAQEVDDGISPFTGERGTQILGVMTWGPEGCRVLSAAPGEEENMKRLAEGGTI